MAKSAISQPPYNLAMAVVGGVDESIQDTDTDFGFSRIGGSTPYFTGTHQRMFGKKLVDVNREQEVLGIAQAFNGMGQFGYFVQTVEKLYYHLCETPTDLHINFTLPATLGVDSLGKTLNIFGAKDGFTAPSPTSGVSCVFTFPDKPANPLPDGTYGFFTPNNNYSVTAFDAAHPDYLRKGMVMFEITGSDLLGYTATELGRWVEGVDFPPADFGTSYYLDISAQLGALSGSHIISFAIWYQNASLNNTYWTALNQVLKEAGASVGVVVNPAANRVNLPDEFFPLLLHYSQGVAIADIWTNHANFRFPINS